MRCDNCGEEKLVPSKARSGDGYFLRLIGYRMYRCNRCCKRLRKLSVTTAGTTLLLCVLLGASSVGLVYYRSQSKTAHVLLEMQVDPVMHAASLRADMRQPMKNEDVVELVRAGTSRDVIYRLIGRSPAQFQIAPADVVNLRKAGVPNDIISQMIETTGVGEPVSPVGVPREPLAVSAKTVINELRATAQ